MRKELGKIISVRFGYGGRDDVMFGLGFTLGGTSWVVGDFWGYWGPGIEPGKYHEWTEEDRNRQRVETMVRIEKLLKAAKVLDVTKLAGVPIEIEFEGMTLKSWRVLEEVL